MVRFSDMLGGNGDSQEARAPVAPPRADDEEPEPEPEPAAADEAGHDEPAPAQSPEDVLDRLTQYATSARASDPTPADPTAPEPAQPAAEADAPLTTVGDDLLPHPKGEKGKRRRS